MNGIKDNMIAKVSVIVPVYNEEQAIGMVLNRLKEQAEINHWEILIVNDASTDNTANIIKAYEGFKVINQPYNKGYGAAIKAGIRAASGEVLVFIDGDGQHDPDDIPAFLKEMEHYDMVVGARAKGVGQSWIRRPGKWVLGKVANYLAGVKIPDINCGFRAVKKICAEEFMGLYPNGFSISTTITLAMFRAGYSVKYIPIKMKYRQGRKSTVKQGADGIKTILLILRCIVLFNPLKIFFPVSFILFFGGCIFTLCSLIRYQNVANSAVIILLSSMLIFFFGLIADQLSVIRRS